MFKRTNRRRSLIAGGAFVAILLGAAPAGSTTASKPYAVPVGDAYETTPLFSVGDRVPETSNPSKEYQMVGIPDGLGLHSTGSTRTLFMNHEFNKTIVSEPVVGGPGYRGSFVSKFLLDEKGSPVSGERAFDTVYLEDQYVAPAAQTDNTAPAIARLCSGFLAATNVGFDQPIYLAGEESDGADTWDGRGGLGFAFFNNEAHALPALGRFSKENVVVASRTRSKTVVIPLEDGPSTPDSQLYMYVGTKDTNGGASTLERNGLVDGILYVFVSRESGQTSEATFQNGTLKGRWVAIPGAENMTDVELEAASDAVGAFGFVRIEDGAFGVENPNEFHFVTTGGNKGAGNELGRLYTLRLNPGNPTAQPRLHVDYNADQVIAAGDDIAISPDNVDASSDYLMIQEDGTTQSRAVMASKNRDGSIWRFPLDGSNTFSRVNVAARERIAELDPPGRDGVPVGPGVWETSGIIDSSATFGEDTWLFDVQAHKPTNPPDPATQVEDGQLLLLTPTD